MPKREAQKERGRKMMVKMVKIITVRDWLAATWDCLPARWASITFACFCFMSRRSLEWRSTGQSGFLEFVLLGCGGLGGVERRGKGVGWTQEIREGCKGTHL